MVKSKQIDLYGRRLYDLKPKYQVEDFTQAYGIGKMASPGDLISVVNPNNLSEVFLYERTNFLQDDPSVFKWDGKSVSYEWYKENESTYYISNAEQLAAFADLVRTGVDFYGKIIYLTANINLNHKEWNPIGGFVDSVYSSLDHKMHIGNTSLNLFRGTFDGRGRTIYGLKITNHDEHDYNAFFTGIHEATIKNLIFTDVQMGSYDNPGGNFATLFGFAKSSKIINVVTSGVIIGEHIGGIGGVAEDSSFYECNNRITLIGLNKSGNHNIIIGGIVEQIGLSEKLSMKLKGQEAQMFVKCEQNGCMQVHAEDLDLLWGGQIYGYLSHPTDEPNYGIVIDRCAIGESAIAIALNLDSKKTDVTMYVKTNQDECYKNFGCCMAIKRDLLHGLLGKTGNEIDITVKKLTYSKIIDSIVVPGTINTLHSERGSSVFMTTSTESLQPLDGIRNLEPYLSFVTLLKS